MTKENGLSTHQFRGIEGLNPRDPVGAAISVGRKKSSGYGILESDRFHIVMPKDENGVRHPHPQFDAFNKASKDSRLVLRGNIVHPKVNDCFTFHLKAQAVRGSMHPDKRPACVGDGHTAERWVGPNPDNFRTIQCPNDRCVFRQRSGSKPPPCKPWGQLLFRLRWPEETQAALIATGRPRLPEILVKYSTGSWNTVANLKGFFDYFVNAGRALGIDNPTLFGAPFTMTLTRQTKASQKRAFPVVVFAPEIDPIQFFAMQAQQRQQIEAARVLPALTDSSHGENYADYRAINVNVPKEGPDGGTW